MLKISMILPWMTVAFLVVWRVDAFAPMTPPKLGGTAPFLSRKVLPLCQKTLPRVSTFPSLCMKGRSEIEGTDRIVSCLPYLLPVLDGDKFGRYIYARVPPLGFADAILLGPLKIAYNSIPFLGFGIFIALSVLSRNPNLSRGVRFNMQQAILLDIVLIFPSLFGSLGMNFPRILAEPASNFVYYGLVASVGYAVISNLQGKTPNEIPIVSEAAEAQTGPFWNEVDILCTSLFTTMLFTTYLNGILFCTGGIISNPGKFKHQM